MKRLAVCMLFLCLADLAHAAKIVRTHKHKPKAAPELTEADIEQRKSIFLAELFKRFTDPEEAAYARKVTADTRFVFDLTLFPKKLKEALPPQPPKKRVSAYAYLFTPESKAKGKDFLVTHAEVLSAVEEQFHVPRNIVVSVIAIETQFGGKSGFWTGNRYIPPTLYTVGVYHPDPYWRDWAVKELAAYIRLCRKHVWDPYERKGSTRGAFGLGQFEPTSYEKLAISWNDHRCGQAEGFRFPDPVDPADSSCSIGNYLHYVGFNPREKRRALYAYNHQTAYVNALLRYAEDISPPPAHTKKAAHRRSRTKTKPKTQRAAL